jgi:hypothetical protein
LLVFFLLAHVYDALLQRKFGILQKRGGFFQNLVAFPALLCNAGSAG